MTPIDLNALIKKAVDQTPQPFQGLVALYLPALYRMTQTDIEVLYTKLVDPDPEKAKAAIRAKMTDAELLAETQAIASLMKAQEQSHALLSNLGSQFASAAVGWALTALVTL